MLAAVSIEHEIFKDEFDWCLLVPEAQAGEALAHLERYQLENRPLLPPPESPPVIDAGWVGVFGYLVVIWMLPWLESIAAFGWDWRTVGRMEAGLVMEGQWWRTVTALTLHGDIAHLIANSLFGLLFGVFVGRYLGSGLGWLLILLAGAIGNGANALLRPEEFRSIGASTATFAALSMGAAFMWRRRYFQGRDWRRNFAPIFAGIALLAYTGMGGGNTDVVAHLTGFAAGIAFGLLVAKVNVQRLGVIGQQLCGLGAVCLVVLAWMLAGSAR